MPTSAPLASRPRLGPMALRLRPRLVAALAGLAAAVPVLAESTPPDETIEDVTITATNRETALTDTPGAVSVVTGSSIAGQGIEDVEELFKTVPGMNYMTAAATYNQITMRGLAPIAGGPATASAYLDTAPVGSSRGQYGFLAGSLFDIERVEVLKGPQGTLYGEGAMGGVVRYIAKDPDPTGFDASVRASLETMDHSAGLGHRVDAMLNMPLGEYTAVRLAGHARHKTGLIDAPGLRDEEDVDWTRETGLRVKIVTGPSDYLTFTAMVDLGRRDVGGPATAFHCHAAEVPYYPSPDVDCSGDPDAQFARDPYQTHLTHPNHPGGGYSDANVYSLTATWDMPIAELAASYARFESDWHYDEEAPPHAVLAKAVVERDDCRGALPDGYCRGGGPDDLVGNRYSSQGSWGLRHDSTVRDAFGLRLVSSTDGAFQWTFGALYKASTNDGGFHGRCPAEVPYHALVAHCHRLWLFHPETPLDVQGVVADWLNNNVSPGRRTHVVNTEKALYGEAAYRLGPMEFALGVRGAELGIDHDVLAPGVNATGAVQASFGEQQTHVSPTARLALRAGPVLLYGLAAHGFRPGVVNATLATAVAALDEPGAPAPADDALRGALIDLQVTDGDHAYGFEMGAKMSVAERRMNVAAAAYYVTWRDAIVEVSVPTPGIRGPAPATLDFVDNVGEAESVGLEIEVWGELFDSLDWALGANWMPIAEVGHAEAGAVPEVAQTRTVGIVPGNRLPSSPKTTGYASLAYGFALAGIDVGVRVDGYWVADQWRGAGNAWLTPGHRTVDARLAFGRGNTRLSVYARNLADEVVVHESSRNGYQFGRARSLGVEFSYRR